jgi:hypothetical protein
MLTDWELLRRLRSIRAAFGPALADRATDRAAVAIARVVHEFAVQRAAQAERRPKTVSDLTGAQTDGMAPAQGKCHAARSRHGGTP